MREIWDSVLDEERFERKLKRLENMTPEQKREYLSHLNSRETQNYRRHMAMNKIIDHERAISETREAFADEIGAFYPQ